MADIEVLEGDGAIIVVATVAGQNLFDFDFLAYTADTVKVTLWPGTLVEVVLALGVDFSVAGLSQEAGGSITLIGDYAGVMAVDDEVLIYRETPIKRLFDYQNAGDFRAETVNRELDTITMVNQELRRDINLASRVPIGTDPVTIFPGAFNLIATYDENGDLRAGLSVTDILTAQGYAEIALQLAPHIPVITTVAGFIDELPDLEADLALVVANIGLIQDAPDNAALARDYAIKAEDLPVVPGEYSAYHWSKKAEAAAANVRTRPTRRHRVVDFHFGCARGVGFISGTDGGIINFTLSGAAAAGALSFGYTGTAPGAGQLIVFLGDDAQYYTAVVGSAAAGTANLLEPLPFAVSAGQNAWSFWDNNAHPNAYGYAAIADYALRQDLAVWQKIYQRPPRLDPPGTLVANTANAFSNPGSATSAYGWTATPSGAGGGAYWEFVPPKSGLYRLVFECNKVTTGSTDIDLTIVHDGTTVASATIKTATAGRHEVDFYAPVGLVAISLTRAATAFYVSDMMIFQQEETSIVNIDYGRHMVFGDSWVFDPVGPADRLTDRLPNAIVTKSGVGGNKASDLIARFAADVAANAPFDFVHVIVGTNDIASGLVEPNVFGKNLATLINLIQTMGATPIIYTSFPGSTDITAWMDMARRYIASVPYYETKAPKVTRHSLSAYCGAGGDSPVLSMGILNKPFRVLESFVSAALNFKEGPNHPATTTLVGVPAGFSAGPIVVTPDPAGRFVQLIRTTGGALEVITGYIDIEED